MNYKFNSYKKPEIKYGHLKLGGKSCNRDSIDINSLYITKNEVPWIGVMGEFHFSRYNKEHWRKELAKMKAGGINIVSTYLFWIYHEEIEGSFDFTGDRDIRLFVKTCQQEGLYVFLRIGPWSHGECRNGGFPDCLLQKNIPLRQNAPEYLEKVQIYFEKIFEQVKDYMFAKGGNIIGVQLDNELGDNPHHLAKLKYMAQEIGFDVPLYTVTGWNYVEGARIPADEVLPVFGGYPEAPWEQHTNALPLSKHYVFNTMRNDNAIGCDILEQTADDGWRLPYELYPFATCELGGGIQVTHHRRPCIKAMDIYAMSLVKLGSGNNLIGYYMYHGGTNKIGRLSTLQESKKSGYPNDYPVLSYDFQAPISEFGEIRRSYGLLNLLHLFVQDYGSILAPMSTVTSVNTIAADDLNSLRYCMRTDGKSGFIFVNHYQRLAKLKDIKEAVISAGEIKFPAIDISGDISFIMPFNLKLGDDYLLYATAQLICRHDNTCFFAAVPGINPEFCFKNGQKYKTDYKKESIIEHLGIKIIILPWDTAQFIRRIDGKIYIGDNCSVFGMDGKILSAEDVDFSYRVYTKNGFEHITSREGKLAAVTKKQDIDKPPLNPQYAFELNYNSPRKIKWSKISVSGPYGFANIDYTGDAAQLYIDGKLYADEFYYGSPWRIKADALYKKECYLAVSELRDDFYNEF